MKLSQGGSRGMQGVARKIFCVPTIPCHCKKFNQHFIECQNTMCRSQNFGRKKPKPTIKVTLRATNKLKVFFSAN